MRRKTVREESGFTLVEVLVASLLMIVGIVGILAVFPQALASVRDSGRKQILNRQASRQLEALRALPFTHTDLTAGYHPTQQIDSTGELYYPIEGLPEEYSLRWLVQTGPTNQDGTAEPEMKRVTVEASYEVRYTSGGEPVKKPRSYETVFYSFLTQPN